MSAEQRQSQNKRARATTHVAGKGEASGDVEILWSKDVEDAFQEALRLYPPCGKRRAVLAEEGKVYGMSPCESCYAVIVCDGLSAENTLRSWSDFFIKGETH
jgi:hypothetical protein